MLRARLRLTDEADPRVRLERVRAHLLECRADTEGALPLIAQLLGIPPEAGYSPIALHPLTQKQRTLEILQTLLLSPAERRPTLLMIEDAHWVDPTTLELAGALLERLQGSRLLVLLSARPTFHQPWPPRESLIGLTVSDVRYLGSQPWPFPRSLMVGFHAVGDPEQEFAFSDGEIAEADWFTRGEVREALANGDWSSLDSAPRVRNDSPPRLLLPGSISIAREIIESWAAQD